MRFRDCRKGGFHIACELSVLVVLVFAGESPGYVIVSATYLPFDSHQGLPSFKKVTYCSLKPQITTSCMHYTTDEHF